MEHLGARRNGVARGLLIVWRHQVAAAVGSKTPRFVPIQIGAQSGGGTAGESARISSAQPRPLEIATPPACGVIKIEMSGAHPGRAESGAGDAFDGAVGAPGHPVIALRSDLKVALPV